jgi:acyl-homoserine-lactone acylase
MNTFSTVALPVAFLISFLLQAPTQTHQPADFNTEQIRETYAANPQSLTGDAGKARAEILWDTWGVPHIFANDTESAARAFGWAQMQSHGNLLLREVARARGRSAEYFGKDLLSSDKVQRTMGLYSLAKEWRQQQTPAFALYLEAFVSGINEYGRENLDKLEPEVRAVLPVTSIDIIAHTARVLFEFVGTAGCYDALGDSLFASSNGWAIGPSHAVSGHSMLLANPHLPWSGDSTWVEAQLVSPEYDVYGATLIGWPVIAIGFNQSLGWTHTVNMIDTCDLYALVPDGNGYRFNGQKRAFTVDKQSIKVRDADGATTDVPFELRHAVQGPVIEKDGKLLAVRAAGFQVSPVAGAMEEWWAMGRARNLHEFEAALEHLQIPMFNVIYADKDGHIMLVCNGDVPIRAKGDAAFWAAPVPGDDSSLVWNRVHSYRDLPKVIDPTSGWVQNSNSAPWYMTMPFLNPNDYPPYMSLPFSSPGGAPSPREESGLRMLMQVQKMSFDALVEDKYSTRSELAEQVLDDLAAAGEQYGSDRGKQAAEILRKWDRKTDAQSRGAALFAQWKIEMDKLGNSLPYAQPFDPKRPLQTPHGLKDPKMAAAALDSAAEKLQSMAGSLDVAWGDLYRLRRGNVDLPGNGGGEGVLGTFRIIDYSQATDGRFQSDGGDSFIAAVEFGPSVHAKVLLTYGNSSDPKSTHFGDQLALSAKKQMRDAWLTRPDVEQHLERRTVFNPNGKITSMPPLQ